MNSWFNIQKDMMNSWFNTGQSSPSINPFLNGHYANGGNQNPWTNPTGWTNPASWSPWNTSSWNSMPWNSMMEQQMKQMQEIWSGNPWLSQDWTQLDMAESARFTAEKMLESQNVVLQMFESMTTSWPKFDQADDLIKWQTGLAQQLKEQMTQMQSQWESAVAQVGELTESSGQMWQTYLQQLQNAGLPGLNKWMTGAEQPSAWLRNWGAEEIDPTNLMGNFWKMYDETFGKLVSSPPLGLTRELNLEIAKGFETWLTYQRTDVEYQRVVGAGWLKFLDAFGKRLAQMAQEGKLLESPRQFIDLWVEVGDEEFTKLFHDDAYAQVQGKLVNSSMAFKRQQRVLLENWLRSNDMPTRSDLDEAHHAIYALRKEVKTLKKEMSNLQKSLADGAAQAAKAQATPVATTAAKSKPTAKPKSTVSKTAAASKTGAQSSAKPAAKTTRTPRKRTSSAGGA